MGVRWSAVADSVRRHPWHFGLAALGFFAALNSWAAGAFFVGWLLLGFLQVRSAFALSAALAEADLAAADRPGPFDWINLFEVARDPRIASDSNLGPTARRYLDRLRAAAFGAAGLLVGSGVTRIVALVTAHL